MELSQLRYFCDVAKTEHMTRSARALHVAQPALSQAIHRLENELDVKLFERAGRNIRLTPEGAALRDRMTPLLEELDDALEDARSMGNDAVRPVRVGIFSASSIVVDIIADYMVGHPRAAFEVVQSEGDGRYDVSVSTLSPVRARGCGEAGSEGRATFRESIGVAVPNESAYGESVSLEELSGERFISLAGSRSLRALCDALCARHGFFPRIGFDSDDPTVVKKMIGLGLGVGFWPERSWGALAGSGARWVALRDPGFERTLAVARTSTSRASDDADRFFDLLIETMTELWERDPQVR